MGQIRSGYHKEIYDLDIRGEMAITPEYPGSPGVYLKRLKGWASKIPDRSYRMRLSNGLILVQRTPLGMNGRLADWQMMSAQTRLLLKTHASRADETKAKKTADYLSYTKKLRQENAGKVRYEHQIGHWCAYRESSGALYAICSYDIEHNAMDNPIYRKWPTTYLWGEEWA